MAKILIVDDSPMQVKILRKMLEKLGHTIYEGDSGAAAIQLSENYQPDIVMLDVIMPDINGFDATRQIRKNPKTKSIPIILVSSKAQETDKQWGMRQGASGYLVKPFNKHELLAVVGEFLEKSADRATG